MRVKTLAEYAREGIGLLFDCFETPDFSDTKRLRDLALEYRNDFMSSIIPAGHSYAVSRCAASLSRSKTVEEIWSGLSQLYTARALVSQDINALSEKLQRIHKRLVGAGLCINITADSEGIREAKDALKPRLAFFKAPALSAGLPFFSESGIKDLPALTCLDGTDESKSSLSVYTAPSETGFAAAVFASSPSEQKSRCMKPSLRTGLRTMCYGKKSAPSAVHTGPLPTAMHWNACFPLPPTEIPIPCAHSIPISTVCKRPLVPIYPKRCLSAQLRAVTVKKCSPVLLRPAVLPDLSVPYTVSAMNSGKKKSKRF